MVKSNTITKTKKEGGFGMQKASIKNDSLFCSLARRMYSNLSSCGKESSLLSTNPVGTSLVPLLLGLGKASTKDGTSVKMPSNGLFMMGLR